MDCLRIVLAIFCLCFDGLESSVSGAGAPAVPRNFDVAAVNSTALRITWTPLSEDAWNAPMWERGYVFFYKSLNHHSFDMYSIPLDADMSMNSFVLPHLERGAEYLVYMRAKNNFGFSGRSPVVWARTNRN